MKSSASDSKPFQSRSKGEIPSQAWRKERLSCVKLNQTFLIDLWRRTLHVLYSMYRSSSAHENFGVMIRFDNLLRQHLSIVWSKYKIRGVPMGRCRVDTCFTFVFFIIGAFFVIFIFLAILTFYHFTFGWNIEEKLFNFFRMNLKAHKSKMKCFISMLFTCLIRRQKYQDESTRMKRNKSRTV